MAGPTDEQRAWVQRVLGIGFDAEDDEDLADIAEDTQTPPLAIPGQPLMPLWVAAKEDLDGDIDTLQRALRADGDEGLLQIAEYGLHRVTEGNSVKLMAALRDADSLKTEDAVATAYDAVRAFQTFLAASPGVDIIEDNPVDVNVPVRAKLGAALDQLARAMQA
jgi:hypothetical protein